MRQYFDFSRIIKKYGKEFTAYIPTEGFYDGMGEWQNGDFEENKLFGAIVNHRENKIFRAEGKLTGDDKALYMLEPIEKSLHDAKVVCESKIYSIGDELQNGEFTGVWAYTLKFVSAFKDTSPDDDISEEVERLIRRLDGVL